MARPALGNRTDRHDGDETSHVIGRARRNAGVTTLALSVLLSAVWLCWRAIHLGAHPIELAVFAAELGSLVAGLIVGVGIASASRPRAVHRDDPREAFAFAFAVADIVGRTRTSDLRLDLVSSFRMLRRRQMRLADLSMTAALIDGPRRLVLVVSFTFALLLGVAPIPLPPLWVAVCGVAAIMLMSAAHVLLSGGRIRLGDRVRWSSAALGELWSGADRDGLAPRRWVGTVAAVVALDLAVALRGMSDRWTHGLTAMSVDDRQMTMLLAIAIVVGGLYTLRTTAAPELSNSHLVSRRTEEGTARQSAIGGAVLIGIVGLLAGILPGDVDAADDDPAGIEQISDSDSGRVDGVHVLAGVSRD
jgi:hypothetical protein